MTNIFHYQKQVTEFRDHKSARPVVWPQVTGGPLAPIFCRGGARDFFKLDDGVVGGGRCVKSLGEWRVWHRFYKSRPPYFYDAGPAPVQNGK